MTAAPQHESWSMASQMYLRWIPRRPGRIPGALRLAAGLRRADKTRAAQGQTLRLAIPEALVISPTLDCGLSCPGCAADHGGRDRRHALDPALLDDVVAQGRELGIGRLALVGGEPLLAGELPERLAREHPDCLLVIFTNGRPLDEARARAFAPLSNVVFFVNVFSGCATSCQGDTLPEFVVPTLERMRRHGLLFGFAATITPTNQRLFAADETLDTLLELGACGGILLDHIADLERGQRSDPYGLSPHERAAFVTRARSWARRRGAAVVMVPEDEALYGGCGAAGRRMVHLSAYGTYDPCPLVPFSGLHAGELRLIDALRSPFFSELRQAAPGWEDAPGSCCFRAAGEAFQELAAQHGVGRNRGADTLPLHTQVDSPPTSLVSPTPNLGGKSWTGTPVRAVTTSER